MLSMRQQQSYDNHAKKKLKMQCELLQKEREYKEYGKSKLIHWNQCYAAMKVIEIFQDLSVLLVMIIALTQSGKTGIMFAIIELISDKIDLDNVYIITGHSSKEWKKQTKDRMPDKIKVYHRNDLEKKFLKDIKDKQNVLIICDEVHMAAEKNQTIDKVFNAAKLNDKHHLYENDIKIIELTATPNGTLYDANKWDNASKIVCSEPGTGYTSCFDLKELGRVHQYKDLCGYNKKTNKIDDKVFDNINEIKDMIYSKYNTPRYHIIRCPLGIEYDITTNNFREVFQDNVKYTTYQEDSEEDDINEILNVKPEKHTIIFIKELCRCSITFNKKYLGIGYERYVGKVNDSVIIQGLLGRLTGYNDNGDSICFTNIYSIDKLYQLWKSKYNVDIRVKWQSNTTSSDRTGHTISTGTFNQPPEDRNVKSNRNSLTHKIFDGYDGKKVRKWICENVAGVPKGPNAKKPKENRFYETLLRHENGNYFNAVATPDDLHKYNMLTWGISDKNKYRVHLCYTDPSDINTLQTWVVYKVDTES